MSNPNDPVVRLYENMRASLLEETKWGAPKRYYASTAGNCERALWYKHSGYRPAPMSPFVGMIAEAGNMGHDLVREAMHDSGTEIRDVEFGPEGQTETGAVRKRFDFDDDEVSFEVSIRPDGKVNIGDFYDVGDKDPWASLEIKTVDGYTMQWLERAYRGEHKRYPEGGMASVEAWLRNHETKQKYFDQMQITMGMTGADFGYLVLYDRSFGQIGFYNPETDVREGGLVVPFDPERFDQLLKKFKRIELAKRTGDAPPADLSPKSKTCKQCDFFYRCHGAFEREKHGLEPVVLYPVLEEGIEHH